MAKKDKDKRGPEYKMPDPYVNPYMTEYRNYMERQKEVYVKIDKDHNPFGEKLTKELDDQLEAVKAKQVETREDMINRMRDRYSISGVQTDRPLTHDEAHPIPTEVKKEGTKVNFAADFSSGYISGLAKDLSDAKTKANAQEGFISGIDSIPKPYKTDFIPRYRRGGSYNTDAASINPPRYAVYQHEVEPDVFPRDIDQEEYERMMDDDFNLQIEEVDKKPSISDDSVYRVFLTSNRQGMIYGMCPKDYKGDVQDFIDKVNRGTNGYMQLNSIPNDKNVPLKKFKFRARGNRVPVQAGNPPNSILSDAFYKNTNNVVTFRNGSVYTGDARIISSNTFQSTIIPGRGVCGAGVPISGNDVEGFTVVGYTTGKFNVDTSECEVIGVRIARRNHPGQPLAYLSKNYTKMNLRYDHISPNITKFHQDAYRVKVITSEQSADLFGFKLLKRKMQDKTYTPDNFKVVRGYTCKKLDHQTVDIVEIKGDDGRFVKFLISEVEFLTIDPDKVGVSTSKKIIKVGSSVRIVDDRKIKLEKNQLLVVSNIKKTLSGTKNSIVSLKDDKGIVHNVLLKQIKAV